MGGNGGVRLRRLLCLLAVVGRLLARRLDYSFELGTEFVAARRIAPLRGEVGHHGFQHLRENGRGGVVVEVDHHLILATAREKCKAQRSKLEAGSQELKAEENRIRKFRVVSQKAGERNQES